jgi:phosphohistidine phosphatase
VKTVLLMRHAEAAPETAAQRDYDRDLTEEGVRIAIQTGEAVAKCGFAIDRIVASAAVRTAETAKLVAQAAARECPLIQLKELYAAPAERFAQVPRQYGFEDETSILIVGHNPGIGQLMCYFAKDMISVPPATLSVFQFDVDSWDKVSRETSHLVQLIRNGKAELS